MLVGLAVLAAAAALLLTGAMSGVFFAFSTAVLPGLDAADARQAVPAMQSINRKILNPVFYTAFFGALLAAAAPAVLLTLLGEGAAAAAFAVGAAVYLLGAFMPTVLINVPLNNALDTAAAPSSADAAERVWADFSPRWTRWNTVRAAASALSLLCVGLAAVLWAAA